MKSAIYAAILVLTIFLSSCSYNYRLEVVNHTSEELKITYKIKEDGYFYNPKILPVEKWTKGGSVNEAENMPESSFVTDKKENQRILTLPPKSVVILEEGNWDPAAEEGMMEIIYLKLSGVNGDMSYSGNKFYKNFEEKNSSFYTIEYK